MTELSEVIKALEVTASSVRGCGLLSCAETMDWAIEQIRSSLGKAIKK